MKTSEVFITNLKELLKYQEFFVLKKATELGKSGNSIRVVITHLSKEQILSHEVKLIKEAKEIKDKVIENLAYIFDFDCSVTNYFSSKKISLVIFFKKLQIKQKKYSELYSEFKETTEKEFKDSDFKIIEYQQIFNAIHIVFKYFPSQNNLYPLFHKDAIKNKFYFSYFVNLKKKFLFNSNKLKEIVSGEGLIYIYRIELLRKKYSFAELGICKESKYLLIKYIKMLYDANKEFNYRMQTRTTVFISSGLVYLDLGIKKPQFHLKHLFNQIKESAEYSPYLFLRRDKLELSKGDLWIPRKKELEDILLNDELERKTVIINRHSKYYQWRVKNKISIKCEELNLLAYYMETEHELIWDKRHNEWRPIPPPPKKVFKINKYLTLKLENDTTNIYVKGEHFYQCKYLLFSFSKDELSEYEEIDSIDEIKDKYDKSHEQDKSEISPEVEFWGHCSNLQAWYEHNYDTRILHSNLAFPLLKRLSKCGDPLAIKVFKEEIALRFESNFDNVIRFLLNNNFLSFLDLDEIELLSKNLDLIKWSEDCFYTFSEQWISKASETQSEKETQIRTRLSDISIKRIIRLDKEVKKDLKIED